MTSIVEGGCGIGGFDISSFCVSNGALVGRIAGLGRKQSVYGQCFHGSLMNDSSDGVYWLVVSRRQNQAMRWIGGRQQIHAMDSDGYGWICDLVV
jgi:hypothetical protein